MKSAIRLFYYVSVMVLIATGTTYSAYGGNTDNSPKKERTNKWGWIGVVIQDVNKKIARKAKLDLEEGAYVKEVLEDSPADSAGIKEGDVIIELNKGKIVDSDELAKSIKKTKPGTKVDLIIVREGEKKNIEIIIGERKELKRHGFNMGFSLPNIDFCTTNRILGLQLLTLNEQLGEYFNTPDNKGVLITEVEKESAAEKAGFKAGDIIIRVGKKTINKKEKVQREISKYDEGDKVEFEIIRKGVKKLLSVEIEEDQSMQQNFFFRSPPHIQRFQFDPFDDTEMNLQVDKFQPNLDQLEIKLEETMKNFGSKWKDIQKKVERCTPGQSGYLIL